MEKHSVKQILFIPKVKKLRGGGGTLEFAGAGVPVEERVDPEMGTGERYAVKVSPDGVTLAAGSPEGLFRARTTLEQLKLNFPKEIPCVEIFDEPDFKARGFYHDVTRGRVPSLETLKRLVDTLAFYKVNQLQLYVEHAFAFGKIPELWEDKTPLAADDIRELDRYCIDRYVDLVPSLSTFGHLYELLRLPRFERLNELDVKASKTKRCLWDRMAHYTLDVCNPESFELVKGMMEEYSPLFSSRYFNICCDETFDLGKGKNAERARTEGTGRLYVDFVKKIIGVVRALGKRPMLWGDIALKHPELISELSAGRDDVIFLNWDYTPEVDGSSVKTFRDAGAAQYVCPGVNGWSRFAADVDRACENISRMARYGFDAGAAGLLNTDWGDCGQVNLLANSYHGLAFGAERSWNAGDCDIPVSNIPFSNIPNSNIPDSNIPNSNIIKNDDFDRRFSFLQWGIDEDRYRLGKILRELGALSGYHFGNLYAWISDRRCLWFREDDVKAMDPSEITAKIARAGEIAAELESISGQIADAGKKREFEEYVWAASATEWLLSVLIIKKKYEYNEDIAGIPVAPRRAADDGRALLERFKTLWRARNRESELRDVSDTMESVISRLSIW